MTLSAPAVRGRLRQIIEVCGLSDLCSLRTSAPCKVVLAPAHVCRLVELEMLTSHWLHGMVVLVLNYADMQAT